jgi:LPXTG-motif cell wall-anchored protein
MGIRQGPELRSIIRPGENTMYWFTVGALIVGIAALIHRYRKNNRNVLALSAVLLLAAGGAEQFVEGFAEGMSAGREAAADAPQGEA